jgi:hypothetical protein
MIEDMDDYGVYTDAVDIVFEEELETLTLNNMNIQTQIFHVSVEI